ncbi:UNKNOWN [Stylonychia lemnae]|uniref:Uncharacterized protein n=1 Tax=Stylonychia lemnae TaxID=5949 RepID=A0A077ZWT4_STYLE|nr:UNKNOWN [Stylonychia lemnae]|eukprot:CDW74056.1 UNKNOWN [Stylonychia lemnae]
MNSFHNQSLLGSLLDSAGHQTSFHLESLNDNNSVDWDKVYQNRKFQALVLLISNLILSLIALLLIRDRNNLILSFSYLDQNNESIQKPDNDQRIYVIWSMIGIMLLQQFILKPYYLAGELNSFEKAITALDREYCNLIHKIRDLGERIDPTTMDKKTASNFLSLISILDEKTSKFYLRIEPTKEPSEMVGQETTIVVYDDYYINNIRSQLKQTYFLSATYSAQYQNFIDKLKSVSFQKNEQKLIELCEPSKIRNLDSYQRENDKKHKNPQMNQFFADNQKMSSKEIQSIQSKESLLKFVQSQGQTSHPYDDNKALNESSLLNNQIYLISKRKNIIRRFFIIIIGMIIISLNGLIIDSLIYTAKSDFSSILCLIWDQKFYVKLIMIISLLALSLEQFNYSQMKILNGSDIRYKRLNLMQYLRFSSKISEFMIDHLEYERNMKMLNDPLTLILEGERIAYQEFERRKRHSYKRSVAYSSSDEESDNPSSMHLFTSFQIKSPTTDPGNMISPDFFARQNEMINDLQNLNKTDPIQENNFEIINMSFGAAVELKKNCSSQQVPGSKHSHNNKNNNNQNDYRQDRYYYAHSSSSSQGETCKSGTTYKSIQEFKTIQQCREPEKITKTKVFINRKSKDKIKKYKNQNNHQNLNSPNIPSLTFAQSQNQLKELDLRRFKSEQNQILTFQTDNNLLKSPKAHHFLENNCILKKDYQGKLFSNDKIFSDISLGQSIVIPVYYETQIQYLQENMWLQCNMKLQNKKVIIEQILDSHNSGNNIQIHRLKCKHIKHLTYDKFNKNSGLMIKYKQDVIIKIKTNTREELIKWVEILNKEIEFN